MDLCDQLSTFAGNGGKPSLAEVAALIGVPAKIDGVDGAEVEPMVRAGRLQEVAEYCERDVCATALVFFRYAMVAGQLSLEDHDVTVAQLTAFIAARLTERPHLVHFAPDGTPPESARAAT